MNLYLELVNDGQTKPAGDNRCYQCLLNIVCSHGIVKSLTWDSITVNHAKVKSEQCTQERNAIRQPINIDPSLVYGLSIELDFHILEVLYL